MNVRRSSDNATQDIGFTSAGDLDTSSLLSFVGTGTGYVTTWYDQSGNSTNATQATTTKQPTIVVGGVLNMVNNRPAIVYDGVDDKLTFSRTISNNFSILACFNVIAGTGASDSTWYHHAGIVDMAAGSNTNDFGTSVDNSGQLYAGVGNPDTSTVLPSPGYADSRMHWMAFVRSQSVSPGFFNFYHDTVSEGAPEPLSGGAGYNNSALTAASQIAIGRLQNDAQASLNGSVNEVLIYSSILSESNRLILERNEGWYFNMAPVYSALTPPLDSVGSSPAAYGLRKLRTGVTKAIKVRRSSDNTTQDIVFDTNGNLDVASLLSFVGTGSGYIDTWYDQSTNSRDATQSTSANQPRIVNAGVLDMQNGKPSLYFDSTDSLATAGFTAYGSGYHVQVMGNVLTNYTGNQNALVTKTNSAQPAPFDYYDNLHNQGNGSGSAQNVWSVTAYATEAGYPYTSWAYDGSSSSIQTWASGMLIARVVSGGYPISDTGKPLIIGSRGDGATHLIGYIGEVITYANQLTDANRQLIERSQLQYFAPPLAAAYVSKWYDQSGNGYDAVQTNPMSQPTLMMPPYGSNTSYPTVMFNGGQYIASSTGHPTLADYSKAAVFSYFNNSNGSNNIISSNGASGRGSLVINGTNSNMVHNLYSFATNTWSLSFNQPYSLIATYVESSKTGTIYASNNSVGSSASSYSATTTPISLGTANYANYLYGTISEAIVFARSLSATDRTAIYTDEQNYFSSQ